MTRSAAADGRAAWALPGWLTRPIGAFCPRPFLWSVGLMVAFAVVFVPLHHLVGPPADALGVFISVTVGFLLPAWGLAVVVPLLAAELAVLYAYVHGLDVPLHIGGAVVLAMGASGGWAARRAWDAVQRQRRDLKAAHRHLLEAQAALVQSAKLASLGELAAGVGHELNQPLQIIRMAVESARRPPAQQSQGKLEEHLDTVLEQTQRAAAIITQLRALGRHTGAALRVDADVNALIRDTLLLFTNRWAEAGIECVLYLDGHLRPVTCHPAQIEEALIHVMRNAAEAVADTATRRILICTAMEGDQVRIEVIDSGRGIAPADLPRIFDPFFTTKPVGEGRGLGLSLSHRILADHGGSITAESAPGVGTTIRLCLPCSGATAAA